MKDAHIKNKNFYEGKRVLVTGHTGFKGSWLSLILEYMGSNVLGYSLEAEKGSLYEKISPYCKVQSIEGDLLNYSLLNKTIKEFKPEIVIHMAAFGFVKECFDDPIRAYETNVMGSLNLLEAIKECPSVKSIVMVSTDKVYENKGDGAIYSEGDTLGGQDPYSSSKTCMELLVKDYWKSYFQSGSGGLGLATVRASNVLAGGDHVQTRLIPSILKSVAEETIVELRNPLQTRPWQSVLDALNGYLTVGRYIYEYPEKYSGAWNIGPTQDGIRTVSWIFQKIKESFASLENKVGEDFQVAESETLGLDIQKALDHLDWQPRLTCERVVEQVVDFYVRQKKGESEYSICKQQIIDFYGEKK